HTTYYSLIIDDSATSFRYKQKVKRIHKCFCVNFILKIFYRKLLKMLAYVKAYLYNKIVNCRSLISFMRKNPE
ncbi:MAG: hypothetical protein WBE61_13885, partial [Nitrososphaeraceae archaeon]